jgi:hypothetical protein
MVFDPIPAMAEPPKLFQLKCPSHALEAATRLNRNNPLVLRTLSDRATLSVVLFLSLLCIKKNLNFKMEKKNHLALGSLADLFSSALQISPWATIHASR